MKRLKVATLFAVYLLLLSFSSHCASANFPSIRPVPCTNHVTGDSGICTFNWSCVNVAHGVHIGPCVDRFFVGTCCKVPQGTAQDDGQAKDSQVHPHNPFYDSLASKVQKEKINSSFSVGQADSALNPFANDNISFSSKTEMDSESQEPTFRNHSSPSANSEKQTLPTTSIHFLFSSFKEKNILHPTTPTSVLYSQPDFSLRSTIPGLQFQHKPVLSHDGWIPVAVEATHNLRKPVITHHSYDLRQPVKTHEQHHLRKPVPLDEAHDLRWPVLEEDSHDQRLTEQPVEIHKHHDPRPDGTNKVVAGDSHDNRLPVVHLLEWLGKWYLSINNQKANNSNNFYYLETTQKVETSSSTTVTSTMTTEPTVNEELYSFGTTTETLVPTSSSISSTGSTDDTHPTTSSNFTVFIRPTTEPFIPKTTLESVQEHALSNISKVCGRSRSGGTMARIVGGRKSRYLRWPWMISLRRYEDSTFKHKCGATLLNEYWAITAAHCVEGKIPAEVLLRLGEHNFRRADELHPHVERRVHVMVLHPEFDPISYENDIALLRFDEPVELKANIAPICLPDAMDDITGRMAVVTGWGRLSEAGELPSSLHEVHMPIISNEECEQMYYEAGYTEHIRDVFVCAGLSSGGLDACEGDSGGPMVLRGDAGQWTLVGLISWGMGCAAPKQPGVYTRISYFTRWIEGIIAH